MGLMTKVNREKSTIKFKNITYIGICISIEREERDWHLAGDFLCAALALGVGLLGDPLAALVGVGERMPWLLVEEVVGPGGAGFGLEINLAALVGEPLAQP